MKLLTESKIWQDLKSHCHEVHHLTLRDLFKKDPNRFGEFSLQASELFLDFSKQRITHETIHLLSELARLSDVYSRIDDMFSGKMLNNTEKRAVLHTALRNRGGEQVLVNGQDVMPGIFDTLEKMRLLCSMLHQDDWLGYSGEPIRDVVNIGIGGSDLGPRFVTEALKPYHNNKIKTHFISNVDGSAIENILSTLNPGTTLFIIASKSFTTLETMTNAETARKWILKSFVHPEAIKKHFIATTANPAKAIELGIDKENIFEFWDWVGGRYSLWSAIGLPIAISIGMDHFEQLLAGAYNIDKHFSSHDYKQNIPVILALLNIWNHDLLGSRTQAVIPYDQSLAMLPTYLQQLAMESNGKYVTREGHPVNYRTAPVVWGQAGTNSQHAFHQLLLQGTQIIQIDFIVGLHSHSSLKHYHDIMFASCIGQSRALMLGKTVEEAKQELIEADFSEKQAKHLAPHQAIPGNRPSNTIIFNKLTPTTLGELLALYEHKTFVEGVIWNINSFDQWGVALGKKITKNILPNLASHGTISAFDSSTNGLIKRYHFAKDHE